MDESYDVSVHKAAAEGWSGLCRELLADGEDVNSMDQLGWTPLMHAVHNGHFSLAKQLLSHGAQVSLCNHYGITPFTVATLQFDEDMQNALYSRLTSDLRQQESNMSLLVACCKGSHKALNWLLENTSADVNFTWSSSEITPLMMVAMSSGDCKMADLLMKSGADPRLKNALGQDALDLALATGNGKLFLLLNQASSTTTDDSIEENVKNTNLDYIDPMFTVNQISLDIQGDVVLKNSPNRPVFKTGNGYLSVKCDERSPFSPSKRSVFLPPPKKKYLDNDKLNCQYNLTAVVTPRRFVSKTPSSAKKRKLSTTVNGISSWLKKIKKRRSKSLADEDDYVDLNILQRGGVDFLKLLTSLGLEEFFPVFKEQELDMWTLLSLTAQDLAAMGIDNASSQIRILAGIQTLRTTQI